MKNLSDIEVCALHSKDVLSNYTLKTIPVLTRVADKKISLVSMQALHYYPSYVI